MSQAKIEVYSRNIKGDPYLIGKGIPQHMFILVTDSQSQQTIMNTRNGYAIS